MTITRAAIMAGIFLAAFARAREGTFPGVEQSIQERTGKMVRWEVDQAAHEQTLRDVRLLLRRPLTAENAVQIALFNNRSLQATFEEIGL
jgi:cobalt-zinc-cadmium efflux system outer membrane protein